jgi:hypothetical protein
MSNFLILILAGGIAGAIVGVWLAAAAAGAVRFVFGGV